MTTTLTSLGIDPTSHGFISADLLLASKLTALYEYAKSLEERVKELDWAGDLPFFSSDFDGPLLKWSATNEERNAWVKANPFPRSMFNVPADQLAQLYIESGKTDMFPKGKMTMALFQLATSVGDLFDGSGWNKWRKDYLEAFEKEEFATTETT